MNVHARLFVFSAGVFLAVIAYWAATPVEVDIRIPAEKIDGRFDEAKEAQNVFIKLVRGEIEFDKASCRIGFLIRACDGSFGGPKSSETVSSEIDGAWMIAFWAATWPQSLPDDDEFAKAVILQRPRIAREFEALTHDPFPTKF